MYCLKIERLQELLCSDVTGEKTAAYFGEGGQECRGRGDSGQLSS